jgi:hypothetical protein
MEKKRGVRVFRVWSCRDVSIATGLRVRAWGGGGGGRHGKAARAPPDRVVKDSWLAVPSAGPRSA